MTGNSTQNSNNLYETYSNSMDYIRDQLRRLDLLIHLQVLKELDRKPNHPLDPFQGLVLTEEEIVGMLTNLENPMTDQSLLDVDDSKVQTLVQLLEKLEFRIKKRRASSIKEGIFLSLPYLSQIYQLTAFEELCIVICLAPELERKYEKFYAYLQDDVTRKQVSVELVLKLLSPTMEERLTKRLTFSPQAPLLKYGLLQISDNSQDCSTPLISQCLKLDDRMVNFLLGFGQMDDRLEHIARLFLPHAEQKPLVFAEDLQRRLREFIDSNFKMTQFHKENVVFYFFGPYGTGKQAMAEAVCHDLNIPLIIIDIEKMLENKLSFEEILLRTIREALLQSAALCFNNFDSLLTNDKKYQNHLKLLLEWIQGLSRLTFLLSRKPWKPLGDLNNHFFIDLEFSIPKDDYRKKIWEDLGKHYRFESNIDFGAVAGKFRITPGQIRDALLTAQNLARWRSPVDGIITELDLHHACQAQSNQKLSTMANKIKPQYSWDDIVLPIDQINRLSEIINQVKYRHIVFGEWGFHRKLSYGKGLNILFSGPPGTGKTMAAEVIANGLNLDLYKINLSQIVSKYIGETEKNLQSVFWEAQASHAILFFDEADALFGKRSEVKNANDRYANIEVAYLLQKMEEYEGITILATNLNNNIDEAFVRRLQFRIDFQLPGEEYRERIWKIMFPEEAPLRDDIDFSFLAKKFKISGGSIKNIVLNAAFLAAENEEMIGMKHLIQSTKKEMQKIGKICSKEDYGEYYNYIS